MSDPTGGDNSKLGQEIGYMLHVRVGGEGFQLNDGMQMALKNLKDDFDAC